MQVFTPYSSPLDCAKALYGDKRFNKQILECSQILDAIEGVGKGWFNHPVVKMYKPYKDWLVNYACCLQAYRNYVKYKSVPDWTSSASYKQAMMYSEKADQIRPPFLTDEFCDQHKRRLFSKNPAHYQQFAKYGKSEENWYVIDGQIVKYVNGKRIKLKIMDYSKETFHLNHFVLWCKGWYRPTNEEATLEETLKIVFELDGYPFAKRMNDFLNIVLTEFDPYYKWLSEYNKRYCTIQMLCQNAINFETHNEMHGYSVSFTECMFYAIVDFFRYIDNKYIKLKKPIYNKELRNKGLCFRQSFRKDYQGMTYAEQNRIASKMFDK